MRKSRVRGVCSEHEWFDYVQDVLRRNLIQSFSILKYPVYAISNRGGGCKHFAKIKNGIASGALALDCNAAIHHQR